MIDAAPYVNAYAEYARARRDLRAAFEKHRAEPGSADHRERIKRVESAENAAGVALGELHRAITAAVLGVPQEKSL